MSNLLQRFGPGRSVPAPRRGPAQRLAAPSLTQQSGLHFTEWLLIGVLSVAYLLSISQPLFGIQLHLTLLNHFALLLLGPALALHLVGVLLNRASIPLSTILAHCWPLVLLALFALVGSSVAKWEYKQPDTYISFGVYLLLLPLYMAVVPAQVERVAVWAKVLLGLWLVASLAALAGEVAGFASRVASLHEIEYLVICGFFGLYYASPSKAIKLLALLMMTAAALLNQKLTGYIILTLALVHILAAAGWRRLPQQTRPVYAVVAVLLTAALAALLTTLYFEFRPFLPSGNAHVRMPLYEAALRQFVLSPVWGTAFLDGSGEGYREAARLLNIPTHSDVLDVLKHGGLIGLTLFVAGYGMLFVLLNRAVSATRTLGISNAYFVAVRFFLVTAAVTFAINPILLKGPFLIVIWGNLGLAAGLALRVLASKAGEKT